MFARDNKTAPHQSRKKREPTSAVELVKTKYGDGVEAHRLFSAPPALSANVFTSLPRSQFTVNGFKMPTISSTAHPLKAAQRDSKLDKASWNTIK